MNNAEAYYLWKCALLPNVTFRILQNINAFQELSQWYIKCCLEGVKTNAIVHRGLAIWERKGKLSTKELKAINGQLKDGEKVRLYTKFHFTSTGKQILYIFGKENPCKVQKVRN